MAIKRILAVMVIIALATSVLATWYIFSRPPSRIVATAALGAQVAPRATIRGPEGGLILLESTLSRLQGRRNADEFLLLDAGNSLFGSEEELVFSQGWLDRLNKLGYDALTLGYRDFEVIHLLEDPASIQVVSTNFKASHLKALSTAAVFHLGDHIVGVLGMVDPATPVIQSPEDITGLDLPGLDAIEPRKVLERAIEVSIDRVRSAAEDLGAAVDVRILLSSTLDPELNRRVAREIPNLNFIIGLGNAVSDGVEKVGNVTLVRPVQGGATLAVIDIRGDGEADISFTRPSAKNLTRTSQFYDQVRSYWIEKKTSMPQNRVIGEIINADGITKDVEQQIRFNSPHYSYFEAPMYGFVTTALRNGFVSWATENKKEAEVDIVFYNSGAVEADLPHGVITLDDLFVALPHNNRLLIADLYGAEILETLNSLGIRKHGILAVSGMRYGWDYHTGTHVDEYTAFCPQDDKTACQPFEAQKSYHVLMTDFIANGGDLYLPWEVVQRTRAAISNEMPTTHDILVHYFERNSPITYRHQRRVRFVR